MNWFSTIWACCIKSLDHVIYFLDLHLRNFRFELKRGKREIKIKNPSVKYIHLNSIMSGEICNAVNFILLWNVHLNTLGVGTFSSTCLLIYTRLVVNTQKLSIFLSQRIHVRKSTVGWPFCRCMWLLMVTTWVTIVIGIIRSKIIFKHKVIIFWVDKKLFHCLDKKNLLNKKVAHTSKFFIFPEDIFCEGILMTSHHILTLCEDFRE